MKKRCALVLILCFLCILLCGCGKSEKKTVSQTGRVPEVSEYAALLEDTAWDTDGDSLWIFLNGELYENYTIIYPYTIEGDQIMLADYFYSFNAMTGSRSRCPSESVTLPIVFSDENVLKIGNVEAYRNESEDYSLLKELLAESAAAAN